jgi:deoxyribodipyrimidine photo-lyase
VKADGDYVLYWMIAARRADFNFSLDRAIELALQLRKPLVIFEPLRVDYPWASDRFHRFVLQGMADNAARFKVKGVLYYPYVEPAKDAGKELLDALAEHACAIVTDDFPAFFLPQMVDTAALRLPVSLQAVDSNGLLPLRAAPRAFPVARSFRRFLQKTLWQHVHKMPAADPLTNSGLVSAAAVAKGSLRAIQEKWPPAPPGLLKVSPEALAALPIDHGVGPASIQGGSRAARAALTAFLDERLDRYLADRDHPDRDAGSGLSPYLHFGHISPHEILLQTARREKRDDARFFADLKKISEKKGTSAKSLFGMSEAVEAFLDQLVTWREIGFNMCSLRSDYDRYASLPDWSKRTLAAHAKDPRPNLYSLAELEEGRTGDPIWNASQMELVREGRIHNYMRMLWGKRILEWSKTPEQALDAMIHLNNKYALDGRDPSSYSGIFWVLGRYDRAWGPERSIFGTVRYMTSASAARKLRLREYVKRYSPDPGERIRDGESTAR